ncbi:RICIN domain-containing protein [Streptomyces sp. WMMB 322]|uniref:RICIN domain-containing protein n=1 Tax=Streptomyces sp. WMMB 322 TaxID=1286821 RepID=UPI0006E4139B|nr:RICIN domain-containing protein [Streptomyces sp. WMMB 322]SCK45787.1 Ricin-type beta-trefoil lectin domain-containing protein [Streptomyces sp. WMMB 322]
MTGSRDERQQDDFGPEETARPASGSKGMSAALQDQEDQQRAENGEERTSTTAAENDEDEVSRVVTTVNPTIVPAGSRSPAPATRPGGRVRAAVLAAVAALALVGLSTGGYLLYGGDDRGEISGSGPGAAPEWQGGQENDAPGYAPSPEESTPGSDKDGKPGRSKSPGGGSHDGSPGDGDKDRPPREGDGKPPPGGDGPPGGSGGGNGSGGTVQIRNHNSDQCINVPDGQARDGMFLEIRTCSGAPSMRWRFADDGSVRALGLCMDVANGSSENGTVIQLAHCSGNPAQQFRLSEGSDLVNPQADKCVAVRDGDVRSGQHLQLWDCSGDDSQKWSPI